MSNTWLGNDKSQFYKSLVRLDQCLNPRSPAHEARALPIRPPRQVDPESVMFYPDFIDFHKVHESLVGVSLSGPYLLVSSVPLSVSRLPTYLDAFGDLLSARLITLGA